MSDNLSFPSQDLAKATAQDVLSIRPIAEGAEEAIRSVSECLDSYFSQFLHGTDCPQCHSNLIGPTGTFVYGSEPGEGHCRECNWPCRGSHNPKRGGKPIFADPLPIILAFHPSQVVRPKEES